MEELISHMLQSKLIRPSLSPYSSPVILVKKNIYAKQEILDGGASQLFIVSFATTGTKMGCRTGLMPIFVVVKYTTAGVLILSVNYLLALEHQFPVGYKDSFRVLKWAL